MSRLLNCRTCREDVRVYELPVAFIDPALYVCGECCQPVDRATQLEIVDGGIREEVREYDPAISELGF